jgi:peptide deformylase
MALRNIRYFGDEILRKKTREVKDFDEKLWQLLDDMKETMDSLMGAGLAAPQVGVLKKAAIVSVDDVFYEIINPQILNEEGLVSDIEGCLSYPGKSGYVKRPQKVTVRAQDRHGKWFEVTQEDFIARAFCHEIDHLNGILYSDKVTAWVDYEKLEEMKRQVREKNAQRLTLKRSESKQKEA